MLTIQKIDPKTFTYKHAVELSEMQFEAMSQWPAVQYIRGETYRQLSFEELCQIEPDSRREKLTYRQNKRKKIAIRSWARRLMMMSWNEAAVLLVAYEGEPAAGNAVAYISWGLPKYMTGELCGPGENPAKRRWPKLTKIRAGSVKLWCYMNDLVWNRRLGLLEDPVFNSRGLAYAKEHQQAHHDLSLTEQDLAVLPEDQLESAEYPMRCMVQLCELVVSPEHQRRGVGTQLVTESMEHYIENVPVPLCSKALAPQKLFLWASPAGKELFLKLGYNSRSEHTSGEDISTCFMDFARL